MGADPEAIASHNEVAGSANQRITDSRRSHHRSRRQEALGRDEAPVAIEGLRRISRSQSQRGVIRQKPPGQRVQVAGRSRVAFREHARNRGIRFVGPVDRRRIREQVGIGGRVVPHIAHDQRRAPAIRVQSPSTGISDDRAFARPRRQQVRCAGGVLRAIRPRRRIGRRLRRDRRCIRVDRGVQIARGDNRKFCSESHRNPPAPLRQTTVFCPANLAYPVIPASTKPSRGAVTTMSPPKQSWPALSTEFGSSLKPVNPKPNNSCSEMWTFRKSVFMPNT